jgi:MFS transporter, YNFM family, putative membrane transport protein
VTLETDPDGAAERLAASPPPLPDHLAFHEPGRPGYGRLVLGLFAAGVATFAALYSTQPLLGVLSRRFAVTPAHAAWSVSLTTLLVGLGMLAAGPLSGRWGRTRTIRWSLVATAALGVVCALAPTWPVLLAARAAQGLALAGVPAVALVYLREEVHPNVHPRATGLYIGGTALGGMMGRLLSGGVADLAGWRWALGSVAVLGGGCALIATLCLPAPRYALRHQYTHSDPSPVADPTRRQALRTTFRLLADRELLGLYLISAAMMGAFVALYNVLGLRLTSGHYHLSVFQASLVFCVYPLGSLGSTLAGRLAERAGRPVIVLAGCLITLAGVALTLAAPLPLVIAGTGVVTFGFFAAHGVASGWAATTGQRRHAAASQASALYLLAYYLGSSVFGELGTGLWSSGGWPAVAALAAALILVAAAAAAIIRGRTSS